MIEVTGIQFKRSKDAERSMNIEDKLFLFTQLETNKAGKAEVKLRVGKTKEAATVGGFIEMGEFSAQDLKGGTGDNPYSQLISKAEALVIEHLQLVNPDCTFKVVSATDPQPEEEQNTES